MCATRPGVGGVVGTTLYNVTNCNNYGEVFVEGIWAAGTAGATRAGGSHQAVFGGVVGYAGLTSVSTAYAVTGCNNYGKVNITNYGKDGGGTYGYLGGVIGGASVPVEDCHNYGALDIKTRTARIFAGGVLGYGTSSIANCSNNSNDVNFTILNTTKTNSQQLGGVVGQAESANKCHNYGNVVFNVENGVLNGKDIYAAGVAGYVNLSVTECTHTADVTLNMNTSTQVTNVKLGGVVGQIKTVTGTVQCINGCSTSADATVVLNTKANHADTNNFVGGVIAQCNNGVKDCVNKAAVTLNWLVANNNTNKGCAVAGVAALQKQVASGCKNEGEVTLKMNNSTCFVYAAGVVGNHSGSMSNCSNSGNVAVVDYAGVGTAASFYGGLAAKAAGTVGDDCTNTGVVTINGEAL